MSSQQFCLKWNNHTSNMLNVFEHLLSTEALVDVTLACDGLSLKAHKMVLSACSPFFQSLFLENPCKHPIVIMKDMSYKDLKAIIDFMYRGEVNVSQDQLSALLKTAETLKVKGLAEVTGENRQAAGVVQQEVSTPQSTPSSQTPQQNQQSMRPESPPMHGKRKRGRPRKRSLSDSNRSDDELVPSKIKEPDSPEIEELSGDASMDGAGDMLRSNSSSQSQVHQPSVNTFSSSKHHSAPSHQVNAQVEEPPSGDDNEFEVEPSKLLEQTLTTDNVPSTASSNIASHFNLPSSSGIEISQVGLGDSQALVPVSAASDALSSTHGQGPDSPQDIKPAILTFDEPPISPVAGPSHQSSDRSMMMYMDQSSMPGPSNYQDQSLVQHDSQPQVITILRRQLPTSSNPTGRQNNVVMPLTWPLNAKLFLLNGKLWQQQQQKKLPLQQQRLQAEAAIIDQTQGHVNGSEEQIIPDSIDYELETDVKVETPNEEEEEDDVDANSGSVSDKITMDSPLPDFSERVKKHIEENTLSSVWNAFVEECASHYYNLYPNMQNSHEYQMIGKKMYLHYPMIEYDGKEPWSFFCKCLSQKIRHKKWKAKRKTLGIKRVPKRAKRISRKKSSAVKVHETDASQKFDLAKVKSERGLVTGKLHRALMLELSEGWESKSLSEKRIIEILKETYKSRENYLNEVPGRRLMYLVQQFPCFASGKYIVHELLMKLKENNTLRLKGRCKRFLAAVSKMRDSDPSFHASKCPPMSAADVVSLIKYVEEKTSHQRHVKATTPSIIILKKDVSESDVNQLLQARKDGDPHLLVLSEGSEVRDSYVLGDQTVINTEASDICEALIVLTAVYYSFGLDYPKTHSQILGLLQTYILGDVYLGVKSYKCTLFVNKLNRELQKCGSKSNNANSNNGDINNDDNDNNGMLLP